MSVKWREGYTFVKKIGPVNWVVENKNGAQKVYHRNLIKLAGSRTEPEFIIQHKPYVLADKGASNIIQPRINIPTTSDPGVNSITTMASFSTIALFNCTTALDCGPHSAAQVQGCTQVNRGIYQCTHNCC